MILLCECCDSHERETATAYCPNSEDITPSYDSSTIDPYVSPLSVREAEIVTEAWKDRSVFGMDCRQSGVWL